VVAELIVSQLRRFPNEVFGVMQILIRLHLMSTVQKQLPWYMLRGAISKKAAEKLGAEIRESFNVLHPHVLKIVNSFGVPEHLLTIPAAHRIISIITQDRTKERS